MCDTLGSSLFRVKISLHLGYHLLILLYHAFSLQYLVELLVQLRGRQALLVVHVKHHSTTDTALLVHLGPQMSVQFAVLVTVPTLLLATGGMLQLVRMIAMFSVWRAITLGRILKMGSQVLFGQAALAM